PLWPAWALAAAWCGPVVPATPRRRRWTGCSRGSTACPPERGEGSLRCLFLHLDRYPDPGLLPVQQQRCRPGARWLGRDGEGFHRCLERLALHFGTAQLLG